MQFEKKKIEKALLKKGFERQDTHHTYSRFYHQGKETHICTYTSHGAKYKTYADSLLSFIHTYILPFDFEYVN